MVTKVRTIEFLPEIFRTETNRQFLAATLDQLTQNQNIVPIQGYIGSRFGYGVNKNDKYVVEPTKQRTDYQLDPAVVFLKTDTQIADDFITYPGIVNALKQANGPIADENSLFTQQSYSWEPFINYDMLINYQQYYWLPLGPDSVLVSTDTIYNKRTFTIFSDDNGYRISGFKNKNPIIPLLRGGTYKFKLNENNPFWIQGTPGVEGVEPFYPNISTREILGVTDNGATTGEVIFTVPSKDAQDEYDLPGDNTVDLICTLEYDQINGSTLAEIGNAIDGVEDLENKRIIFYGTESVPYQAKYYRITYDTNNNINFTTQPSNNYTNQNEIEVVDMTEVYPGLEVTGTGVPSGTIITNVINSTIILNNNITVTTLTNLTFNNNRSPAPPRRTVPYNAMPFPKYDQSYLDTTVSLNNIEVGYDQTIVIRLVEDGDIPTLEKISVLLGTQYQARNFFRNLGGQIEIIPYLSAALDRLYYQNSNDPNSIGILQLFERNSTSTIYIDDIIGQVNYTSPNGVVFTNGLKVLFQGNVEPAIYLDNEFYVDGVGESIQLIPVSALATPEPYTQPIFVPYDMDPYDSTGYDVILNQPIQPDYITISRLSKDKNAWSRSNRWFHYDVLQQTYNYTKSDRALGDLQNIQSRAKRPIIEFHGDIRLFDNGIISAGFVDFLDTATYDVFSTVEGIIPCIPTIQNITLTSEAVFTVNNSSLVAAQDNTVPVTLIEGQGVVLRIPEAWGTEWQTIDDQVFYIYDITVGLTTTTFKCSYVSNINVPEPLSTQTFSAPGAGSAIASFGEYIVDGELVFDGCRVVVSNDFDPKVRSKVYLVKYETISNNNLKVISLVEDKNVVIIDKSQIVVTRGQSIFDNSGRSYAYYSELNNNTGGWQLSQFKTGVNQPPLFNIFNENGISLSDTAYYPASTFAGTKLFSYTPGPSNEDDPVLGFPIQFTSIENTSDINFTCNMNVDTFTYVDGSTITENINIGYVNYITDLLTAQKKTGWVNSIESTVQYQTFTFETTTLNTELGFTTIVCDISTLPDTGWNPAKVWLNNKFLEPTQFTYTTTTSKTTLVIPNTELNVPVVVQLLSNEVSKNAYYSIPPNFENNPFNVNTTTIDLGGIRNHWVSICENSGLVIGNFVGNNNSRDLPNLDKYGDKIIQHSASLLLPALFLRNPQYSLLNALAFNAVEYINYKQLIIDTADILDFLPSDTPSYILNTIIERLVQAKADTASFFWSDMLFSGDPYITNSYTFRNTATQAIYTLGRIYDYNSANYYGLGIYVTRTINNVTKQIQLYRDVNWVTSTTAPSVTITYDFLPGDVVTILEFNQTWGTFCPNTPSKLGLYPAFLPQVVYDTTYVTPTYFIQGHDGSYNKLYGEYINGFLTDPRDIALFEFEMRVWNNIKVNQNIPITSADVIPGYFRQTDYNLDDIAKIKTPSFLNWVGKNRVEYRTNFYRANNSFTYNYRGSTLSLDNSIIRQGNWRGLYKYLYDTDRPHVAPWEMLGFSVMPSWWLGYYGNVPYTSDNTVLWNDLSQGFVYNGGDSYYLPQYARPQLLDVIPVNSNGDLISPLDLVVLYYDSINFTKEWQPNDCAPTEESYELSSTYPFDMLRLFLLSKPTKFFNLNVDRDLYQYNTELGQWLYNGRQHITPSDIVVYGSGTAKHSYINFIVDYMLQRGVDATTQVTNELQNLDVRLVYRMAGFTTKKFLSFLVEKASTQSQNTGLLIPDESYAILLYENVPSSKILYSSIVVQKTEKGYTVWGNSLSENYFTVATPINTNIKEIISYQNYKVTVSSFFSPTETTLVPYGTEFYSLEGVSEFLVRYGAYLTFQGVTFNNVWEGVEYNWKQIVAEFLYWQSQKWQVGSLINLNPTSQELNIEQTDLIVQPLTFQQQNFVLDQNMFQINPKDLLIDRNGTIFNLRVKNEGDTISLFQCNLSNIEHAIVFDNYTVFNDVIYNVSIGLRQNRILMKGYKTAEWNGYIDAQGFILNQGNIQEWQPNIKYTKGQIIKYKNEYWVASMIIEPNAEFNLEQWLKSDYDQVREGLLANPSAEAQDALSYYDVNNASINGDADLLSYSLIGFRPRQYLAAADLSVISQVNIYKNFIKEKGTNAIINSFKKAEFVQGQIDYEVFENWAIQSGEFGAVNSSNFVEGLLDQSLLNANPTIIGFTDSTVTEVNGAQQEINIDELINWERKPRSANFLPPMVESYKIQSGIPTAGYVNYEDVKFKAFSYNDLNDNSNNVQTMYYNDYVWLANYLGNWNVSTPISIGGVLTVVQNNLNRTCTFTFNNPHGLIKNQRFSVVNFDASIDGYLTVKSVSSLFSIIVDLDLPPSTRTLTGIGITFKFLNHRLTQPSNIVNYPVTSNEFTSKRIWVDNNGPTADMQWAVWESVPVYAETTLRSTAGTGETGAVAYNPSIGTVVAYSGLVKVFTPIGTQLSLLSSSGVTSLAVTSDYIFTLSGATLKVYDLPSTTAIQTIVLPSVCTSITVSATGSVVYVGSPSSNAVYQYVNSGTWTLSLTVSAPAASGSVGAVIGFGTGLACSSQGNKLFVGAPNSTISTITQAGCVYCYDYTGSAINLQQTIINPAPHQGALFGKTIATFLYGSDFVVGAPFNLQSVDTSKNVEGAVYRYTSSAQRYGSISGTVSASYPFSGTLYIDNDIISITSAANLQGIVTQINAGLNGAGRTAMATSSGTTLTIAVNKDLVDTPLNLIDISSNSVTTLQNLGLIPYTLTQTLFEPYKTDTAQFGWLVAMNSNCSVAISAPTATKHDLTTFDYTDDYTSNDTIFDWGATVFIDGFPLFGEICVYDYLPAENESITNPGKLVFAEYANDPSYDPLIYGLQPQYSSGGLNYTGTVITTTSPLWGTPDVGRINQFTSASKKTWNVVRAPLAAVNINNLEYISIYDVENNMDLNYLDYIDPIQGKLLGAVQSNIDYITISDPAGYGINSVAWTSSKVGRIWFDPSEMRMIDCHQSVYGDPTTADNVYNSRYWAEPFVGSIPKVYSWTESSVDPLNYVGPGVPRNFEDYVTVNVQNNETNSLVTLYYFWVENNPIVYTNIDKTLNTSTIASYLLNPLGSGISYLAPIGLNSVALYNANDFIRTNSSALHIGYSTNNSGDQKHVEFNLIHDNDPFNFLNGLPNQQRINQLNPTGLYLKYLNSFSGKDSLDQDVPDPNLPPLVRYGTSTNYRQSMFRDRTKALQNYIEYVNQVVSNFPIAESRVLTYLNTSGTGWATSDFWDYTNYWIDGYSNATKAQVQVQSVPELATVTKRNGLVARVSVTTSGNAAFYVYNDGIWSQIGIENGTVNFLSTLWTNTNLAQVSKPIYWIIRAINEQIFISDLQIERNRSLILMFKYIMSEAQQGGNYIPWLNKTSLIDVSHTIRQLIPYEKYQRDQQEFLDGYLTEVKPYHVVINDFSFRYEGGELYDGDISDFDVPATYKASINNFESPILVYDEVPVQDNEYNLSNPIWLTQPYRNWISNYGLQLDSFDVEELVVATVTIFVSLSSTDIYISNTHGLPTTGYIQIGQEIITYDFVDYYRGRLAGLGRAAFGTTISTHDPGEPVICPMPPVTVIDTGRVYTNPPTIDLSIDTSIYPPPRREAILKPVMANDRLLEVEVIDEGDGYAVQPEIIIEPAFSETFPASAFVNIATNRVVLTTTTDLKTGDCIRYTVEDGSTPPIGLTIGGYYYVRVDAGSNSIYLFYTKASAVATRAEVNYNQNKVMMFGGAVGNGHVFNQTARAVIFTTSQPVREIRATIKLDRTSYRSSISSWDGANNAYAGPYTDRTSMASSLFLASGDNYGIISLDTITVPNVSSLPTTLTINTTASPTVFKSDQQIRVSALSVWEPAVYGNGFPIVTYSVANAPFSQFAIIDNQGLNPGGGAAALRGSVVSFTANGSPDFSLLGTPQWNGSYLTGTPVQYQNPISTITANTRATVTTSNPNHYITNWQKVYLTDIPVNPTFGNSINNTTFYANRLSNTAFYLYNESATLTGLSVTANYSSGAIVNLTGGNVVTTFQVNDRIQFGGDSNPTSFMILNRWASNNNIEINPTINPSTTGNVNLGQLVWKTSPVNTTGYTGGNAITSGNIIPYISIVTLTNTYTTTNAIAANTTIYTSSAQSNPKFLIGTISNIVGEPANTFDINVTSVSPNNGSYTDWSVNYYITAATAGAKVGFEGGSNVTSNSETNGVQMYMDFGNSFIAPGQANGQLINVYSTVAANITANLTANAFIDSTIQIDDISGLYINMPITGSKIVANTVVTDIVADPNLANAPAGTVYLNNFQTFTLGGNNQVVFSGGWYNENQFYVKVVNDGGNFNTVDLYYDPFLTNPVPSTTFIDLYGNNISNIVTIIPQPITVVPTQVSYAGNIYIATGSPAGVSTPPPLDTANWVVLESDSNLINGIDRIQVYYSPTVDMPGIDVRQLVPGVEYPNNIYFGGQLDEVLYPQSYYDTDLISPSFTSVDITVYDVSGGQFADGYAPPELVAGVVSDNIDINVRTRPGSLWDYDSTTATQVFRISSVDLYDNVNSNNILTYPPYGSAYFVPPDITIDSPPTLPLIFGGVEVDATAVAVTNGKNARLGNVLVGPVGAINEGRVLAIYVQDAGFGYGAPPTIIIDQPRFANNVINTSGLQAQAVAQIRNGTIVGVVVTQPGMGYDPAYPPKVVVVDEELIGIRITNGGEGYSDEIQPSVAITAPVTVNTTISNTIANTYMFDVANANGIVSGMTVTTTPSIDANTLVENVSNNTVYINIRGDFSSGANVTFGGVQAYANAVLGNVLVDHTGFNCVNFSPNLDTISFTKVITSNVASNVAILELDNLDRVRIGQLITSTTANLINSNTVVSNIYYNNNSIGLSANTVSSANANTVINLSATQFSFDGIVENPMDLIVYEVMTNSPIYRNTTITPDLGNSTANTLVFSGDLTKAFIIGDVITQSDYNINPTANANTGIVTSVVYSNLTTLTTVNLNPPLANVQNEPMWVFETYNQTRLVNPPTTAADANVYYVDWNDKVVTMNNQWVSANPTYTIDAYVYEVGGGNELERTNTKVNPVIANTTGALTDIYLDASYREVFSFARDPILSELPVSTNTFNYINQVYATPLVYLYNAESGIYRKLNYYPPADSSYTTITITTAANSNQINVLDGRGVEVGTTMLAYGLTEEPSVTDVAFSNLALNYNAIVTLDSNVSVVYGTNVTFTDFSAVANTDYYITPINQANDPLGKVKIVLKQSVTEDDWLSYVILGNSGNYNPGTGKTNYGYSIPETQTAVLSTVGTTLATVSAIDGANSIITVNSTTDIYQGMYVSGGTISGTTIVENVLNSTDLQLSSVSGISVTNVLTFAYPQPVSQIIPLTNFIGDPIFTGDTNETNAVVEINGKRLLDELRRVYISNGASSYVAPIPLSLTSAMNDIITGTVTIASVVYNYYVAVGNNGIIVINIDDFDNPLDWVPQIPVTTENLNSIATGNGVFVIVGNNGTVITMSVSNIVNAHNLRVGWQLQAAPTSEDLNSIIYSASNTTFVAVGSAREILKSSNGIIWNSTITQPVIPISYTTLSTTHEYNFRQIIFNTVSSTFIIVGDCNNLLNVRAPNPSDTGYIGAGNVVEGVIALIDSTLSTVTVVPLDSSFDDIGSMRSVDYDRATGYIIVVGQNNAVTYNGQPWAYGYNIDYVLGTITSTFSITGIDTSQPSTTSFRKIAYNSDYKASGNPAFYAVGDFDQIAPFTSLVYEITGAATTWTGIRVSSYVEYSIYGELILPTYQTITVGQHGAIYLSYTNLAGNPTNSTQVYGFNPASDVLGELVPSINGVPQQYLVDYTVTYDSNDVPYVTFVNPPNVGDYIDIIYIDNTNVSDPYDIVYNHATGSAFLTLNIPIQNTGDLITVTSFNRTAQQSLSTLSIVGVQVNSISSIIVSGTTATVTTVYNHNFVAGEIVIINRTNSVDYDQTNGFGTEFEVLTTPTSNTFTILVDSGSEDVIGNGYTFNKDLFLLDQPDFIILDKSRLWITINGYRVDESNFILSHNQVQIFREIIVTDEIGILSMTPGATPNAQNFTIHLNKNNQPTVMRVPTTDCTYVSEYYPQDPPIDTIYVDRVLNLFDILERNATVGALPTIMVEDPILVANQVSKVEIIGTKYVTNVTQDVIGVVTTSNYHDLNDGDSVVLQDIVGMYELNGLTYYAKTSGYLPDEFALYEDNALTIPLDTSGYNAYTSGGYYLIENIGIYVPDSYNSILVNKTYDLGTPVKILVYVGNTVAINGEYIRFKYFDTTLGNNSISGLSRGFGGTIVNETIPRGSLVKSLLPSNILWSGYYGSMWNDARNNPLQISETPPAEFLRRGYE